jgi:transcription elongation factor SPT5
VDEDEDELEEEDDHFAREADGFIDPDDLADLPAGGETDDRRHRQLDRQREREAGLDAEKQAEVFKQRYGRSRAPTAADAVAVPKRLLLPSVEDPSIWGVKCKQGKEREIIFGIMKRVEERMGTKMQLSITSAFERGGTMAGYIYVEARKQSDIVTALEGLSNVYPRPGNIVLVPIKEMPDLLRTTKTKALEPGAYVRIKRGKYQGDLAQIDAVETNGLEVLLRIIPRLDYGLNEDANAPEQEVHPASKRKRAGGNAVKLRPPQRLFSEVEARKKHSKYLQRVRTGDKTHWTYLGDDYDNGYLMKDFKIQHLNTENVNPKLEEVTLFASGGEDGTENLDLNALAASFKESNANASYLPGDMVEVYDGEQQGVCGRAERVSGNIVALRVTEGELRGQVIDAPVKSLRKRFREGDHVKVIGGSRFRDEIGMVVRISQDRVTILSDISFQELTVFSKDLREASDSGTSNATSLYRLHDLVQLELLPPPLCIARSSLTFIAPQPWLVLSRSTASQCEWLTRMAQFGRCSPLRYPTSSLGVGMLWLLIGTDQRFEQMIQFAKLAANRSEVSFYTFIEPTHSYIIASRQRMLVSLLSERTISRLLQPRAGDPLTRDLI